VCELFDSQIQDMLRAGQAGVMQAATDVQLLAEYVTARMGPMDWPGKSGDAVMNEAATVVASAAVGNASAGDGDAAAAEAPVTGVASVSERGGVLLADVPDVLRRIGR
jgi:hypothetical protein